MAGRRYELGADGVYLMSYIKRSAMLLGHLSVCLFIAAGAFSSARAAEDLCVDAITTVEINACSNEKFQRAEHELNATYKKVLARFDQTNGLDRPQDQQKKSLITAQRHWIKFREANCFTVWLINADGTIRTQQNLACMTELARQREEQLQTWFLAQ
jgi:uncharacterized protein YecT (DUF1311 family)